MNKIRPGSIPHVDKEAAIAQISNITKFLATCSSTLGLPSEDLFLPGDLIEGSTDSVARVSRTIIAVIETLETPPQRFQDRGSHEQLRSLGHVPPMLIPPPRSPLRPKFGDDPKYKIPSISSVMGSSSRVDLSPSSTPPRDPQVPRFRPSENEIMLSDTSSILSDTTTFSSLLDPGRSIARNQHSPSRGSAGTFMTSSTARTSYSSLYNRDVTPSIPSLDYEYHRGKKRSSGDSRSPGLLQSGLRKAADVDLSRVAEEVDGGRSGLVDKLGLREKSSSEDNRERPRHAIRVGKGKWPDDFLFLSSPPPGNGVSKGPSPILPSQNTPTRRLVLRNRNVLENSTAQRTFTVTEEGKPATHFVSVLHLLISLSGCRIPYLMYLIARDRDSGSLGCYFSCRFRGHCSSDTFAFRFRNSEIVLAEDSSERCTEH